jgi:hypothetical protein
MFTHVSHAGGISEQEEILFTTRFGYFFPDAAHSPYCLLHASHETEDALRALGDLMADPGTPQNPGAFDSSIPAVFTYLGQFIDHDLTARTDRNGLFAPIGETHDLEPVAPDTVIANLFNGRRPQFDLDSVYGDGPGLAPGSMSKAQPLYEGDLTMKTFASGGRFDLPRGADRHALIADVRNDENVMIGQLHNVFLRFHNAAAAKVSGSDKQKYIRARQLTRWAYQFLVVNAYLPAVCDTDVVADVLANGPRFIGPTAGQGEVFMPLEFSVAGFRFGHSMIRPFYKLNNATTLPIMDLLGPAGRAAIFQGGQLAQSHVIDWKNFLPGAPSQKARLIDPMIAQGLFDLSPLGEGRGGDAILKHLARSNLIRGYKLSIPHGRAMASAFGLQPLTPAEVAGGSGTDPALHDLLTTSGLDDRPPLWFYVLKEAQVQQNGQRLGALGSRIVAETIVSLIKQDPNSYMNNRHDKALDKEGEVDIDGGGGKIKTLKDFFDFAGVL